MNRFLPLALVSLAACSPGADDPGADDPGADPLADADTPPEAAADASPGDGWIEVVHGERSVRTWIAYPETDGPAPTVIVIHQNRGISEWVRSVADRLAEEGYIAAAPDLLSGMAPGGGNTPDFADSDAARRGIGELPPEQVTADLRAVADHLAALPGSDGTVSVAGFCWGGRQTFRFATNRTDLTAAYVFYGTGPDEGGAVERIGAPVYGFYGGADNRVNATIESTEELMEAAGKTYDPVVYDGAGHGFMSRGESAEEGDPNRAAMEAAWERWRELLARHRTGGD